MRHIRKLLKRLGIYYYLRYSRLFGLYVRCFKDGVMTRHQSEVTLYKSILSQADLVFDIGAYDGHKTAAFLELSKRVIACEPDPENFKLLKWRFRNKKNRVILKNIAVSDQSGSASMHVHHPGSAFNTLNESWKKVLEADHKKRWDEDIRFSSQTIKVETATLDELIDSYGIPDFIKIDVEGLERLVFMGLTGKVPCVSFECLLPEFKNDLLFILNRLVSFDNETRFNVVYNEQLLFSGYRNHDEFVKWIDTSDLFSFDVVARSVSCSKGCSWGSARGGGYSTSVNEAGCGHT